MEEKDKGYGKFQGKLRTDGCFVIGFIRADRQKRGVVRELSDRAGEQEEVGEEEVKKNQHSIVSYQQKTRWKT